MSEFAELTISDRLGYITINRPEKRNALNGELVELLTILFEKADRSADVKVIVLKASGEVFSAGADLEYLKMLQSNTLEQNLEDSASLKRLFKSIYMANKPVIACVEGHAIAGGCGLVSVCDFVFAVPEAKFGYPEVKIGFIPALVSVFLLRKLGESRAKELLLTGRIIEAQQALDYGLINFIFGKAEIAERVHEFGLDLANGTSAESIRRTKQLLRFVQDSNMDDGLNEAVKANAEARSTDDFKRGITSFLLKEDIKW